MPDACEGQEMVSDALEVELQMAVNHHVVVAGSSSGFSARATSAYNNT